MFFVAQLIAGSHRQAPPASAAGRSLGRVRLPTAWPVTLTIALLCSPTTSGSAVAAEVPTPITVELDHAMLMRLPATQRRIILDNPGVARATYLPGSNQVVLTGISYGETRLTVLDAAGEVAATSILHVREAMDGVVTVHRGQQRGTYVDCEHLCQPRLQLGDAETPFKDIAEQIHAREPKSGEALLTQQGGHL